MSSLSRIFRGAALCASLSLVSTLSAAIYFDNTGETLSPNVTADPAQINNNSWYAQSFVTDTSASNFTLNTITLSLGATTGSPDGVFFVDIYSNISNAPGTSIQPLSGNHNPTTAGDYDYAALLVTLQPNTTYWVVAHGLNSSGSGNYNWNYTESSNITGGWTTIGWTSSADGTAWDSVSQTAPQMMSVTATPHVVPEPGTWALLCGTAALGFVAWRKRKSA